MPHCELSPVRQAVEKLFDIFQSLPEDMTDERGLIELSKVYKILDELYLIGYEDGKKECRKMLTKPNNN